MVLRNYKTRPNMIGPPPPPPPFSYLHKPPRPTYMNLPQATMDLPQATMDLPEATMDLPEATMDLPEATMDLPEATMDLFTFYNLLPGFRRKKGSKRLAVMSILRIDRYRSPHKAQLGGKGVLPQKQALTLS